MLFISGLPRAGSTLLAAILKQNPAFHADMSSPLLNVVSSVQRSLSRAQELAIGVDDAMRLRMLRGLFDSYYAPQAGKVVFDTNRVWTNKLDVLLDLYPDTRIICCVRSLGAIIESFERLFREHRLQLSAMFGFDPEINVYGRVERMMMANGVIGVALNGLKEAFYGPNSDRLLLVDYDVLANRPDAAIRGIYEFIGQPGFAHDFNHVEFAADDFDAAAGMPGMHKVKGKVAPIARQPTLPPDIAGNFRAPEFWSVAGQPSKAKRIG